MFGTFPKRGIFRKVSLCCLIYYALHLRYLYVTFISRAPWSDSMARTKTATLNLRINPMVKEAARLAALREDRSIANLIEILIKRHCEKEGIPIPEQQLLFEDDGNE